MVQQNCMLQWRYKKQEKCISKKGMALIYMSSSSSYVEFDMAKVGKYKHIHFPIIYRQGGTKCARVKVGVFKLYISPL